MKLISLVLLSVFLMSCGGSNGGTVDAVNDVENDAVIQDEIETPFVWNDEEFLGAWEFEFDGAIFPYVFDKIGDDGFIWGIDQKNEAVGFRYSDEVMAYIMADTAIKFNHVFVFNVNDDSTLSGCHYFQSAKTHELSECVEFTGLKLN